MPLLPQTITALASQKAPFAFIAFDNASHDGTREVLDRCADRVLHVAEGSYIPGRVLNLAMQQVSSDIVIFLNADCTPLDENWLQLLIGPFDDPNVAATFSRQLPRPDCSPLAARDTEAAYGDGSGQAAWRNCFSMASCAVRRSVWELLPFNETLAYSEDIAWTKMARDLGYEIRYVSTSRVYHSHNYTNQQWRKRQFGEGKAEAAIFPWSRWQRSLIRYSIIPMLMQILRDARYCASTGNLSALLHSPGYRFHQMAGRRQGFLAASAEVRTSTLNQPLSETA
jgi:rhamnosyltransferase